MQIVSRSQTRIENLPEALRYLNLERLHTPCVAEERCNETGEVLNALYTVLDRSPDLRVKTSATWLAIDAIFRLSFRRIELSLHMSTPEALLSDMEVASASYLGKGVAILNKKGQILLDALDFENLEEQCEARMQYLLTSLKLILSSYRQKPESDSERALQVEALKLTGLTLYELLK